MHPGPIVVERKLLESKAYHDLDGKAAKVLMWFLAKRKMIKHKGRKRSEWEIANNGEIVFPYKEAEEKHGLSGQVFSRLIGELMDKGFIDITIQGIGAAKAPSLYAISGRWRNYGTAEFKSVVRPKRISHRFPTGANHPIHSKRKNGV